MTPKMVANFRRSLSFPNHPITSSSTSSSKAPKKTLHVRSTSLPCRSHPLIFQLKDEINELRSSRDIPHNRTSALVCDALNRLNSVHESLDDLLQLPQTRESLIAHSDFIEIFLEDFLRFIDLYGIFQTLVLKFKEEHSAAHVAVRRKDDSKVALYLKTLKKMAKEMGKLSSAVQCMAKQPGPTPVVDAGDAQLIGAIKDVIEVTIWVSVALFNGLAVSLACRRPPKSSRKGLCLITGATKKVKTIDELGIQEFQQIVELENLWGLRKKGEEELKSTSKKMHELEDCIGEIEIGGEKVFRSLINARVSLLNVLTQ